MPLSNAQYDEIMRGYDARQIKNKHIADVRTSQAYQRAPRLKEIDTAIAETSIRQAKKIFDGDDTALADLKRQLADYRIERRQLLTRLGYPPDYLAPVYTCPDCKDTGYIGGKQCHCFKQAVIDAVYAQSNLRVILADENFSAFSLDYYSKDMRNPATGLSAYETALRALEECRHFIDTFEQKPNNLFFYGDTGVGKTFLSNCVAKELLDKGYSVIYFTAFQLFDILSKGVFDKDADAIAAHQNIFDCDLLIIDDLGTELSNSFTTSQLFLCVNERILRQKSTIISTNLNMGQLADIYSERTLSRISSNYTILKLFGDDIRIQKRRQQ